MPSNVFLLDVKQHDVFKFFIHCLALQIQISEGYFLEGHQINVVKNYFSYSKAVRKDYISKLVYTLLFCVYIQIPGNHLPWGHCCIWMVMCKFQIFLDFFPAPL